MTQDFLLFDVSSTDYQCPLHLTVSIDNICYQSLHVYEPQTMSLELNDLGDYRQYLITLEMQGKLSEHTVLDSNGEFVRDPRLIFSNWQLSQVPCEFAVHKLSNYRHDCNGSAVMSDNHFSGVMGCNGTVNFSISTPFLLWLLENT